MKSLSSWAAVTLILAAFLAADQLHAILSFTETYRHMRGEFPFYVRSGARNVLQVSICFLVVRVTWARSTLEALQELGFDRRLLQGLAFGVAATAPMFIGLASTSSVAPTAASIETAYLAGVSPLTEEIVYRGFACGLLFTRARLPVWVAVSIPALVFGWGHVEQGSTVAEGVGLFLYTGGAGAAFGWVYLRWQRNLWIPIAVHVLGNLSWELFDVADSALGGWFPFGLQMTMVLLAIAFTLRWTGSVNQLNTNGAQIGGTESVASS